MELEPIHWQMIGFWTSIAILTVVALPYIARFAIWVTQLLLQISVLVFVAAFLCFVVWVAVAFAALAGLW